MLQNRMMQMTNLVLTCVILFLASAVEAAPPQGTVKVFILTGQSNMEGKGLALHLDTYKEDPLIKDTYASLKKNGEWVVRDDVWITYPTKRGSAQAGRLTVGYGTKGEDSIGPEFGFGHTIGKSVDAPVVLIKIAWGGKSLAVDFHPPSAGLPDKAALDAMLERLKKRKPKTTLDDVKAKYGFFYRQLIEETKNALANLGTTFPELKGSDYEIAGIVWHQGFNDVINRDLRANKYTDYTKWLGMFIKDIRKDLNAPNAPFVIGELSTGGIPNRGDFQTAQAAAADLPGFKGNVAFVPTAEYYDTKAHELYEKGYWKGTDEQKAQWRAVGNDRPYHYLGSGKTYYLKGQAFGDAMLKMIKQDGT
ncbi:MAG: sialate O-acetylesterase [Pirellulaceae bacterium]|nr:sialate O-acetylesterase [Pirellulaceae bacterium]